MLGSTGERWEEFSSNPTILACDLVLFHRLKEGEDQEGLSL